MWAGVFGIAQPASWQEHCLKYNFGNITSADEVENGKCGSTQVKLVSTTAGLRQNNYMLSGGWKSNEHSSFLIISPY